MIIKMEIEIDTNNEGDQQSIEELLYLIDKIKSKDEEYEL